MFVCLLYALPLLLDRYLGVLIKSSSGPDVNIVPKSKSTVVYQWSFCTRGIVAEKQVTVRCAHVKDQGVPFPGGWEVAFRALALPQIAQRSAAKAIAETGQSCLQCKVLGAALPLPELAVPSEEEQVGSLMVISGCDGNRCAVVLCAHVQGTEWLYYPFCHSDAADIVDIDHLLLDDLASAERLEATKEDVDKFVSLIHENQSRFSELLAEAAWKAEEHRASSRSASFNADIAIMGFEANPFSWHHGNSVRVCVAWTSAGSRNPPSAAAEIVPSKFGWHRLDDALSKGWSFPSPRFHAVPAFKAEELHSMLEEKAKWAEKTLLWPCGYLGYLVRGNAATGQFEPDPGKLQF